MAAVPSVVSNLAGGLGDLLNRKSVAATIVLSLVSTAIVIAAVRSDGSVATSIRLDDGAVWVTNQERVGRLNVRINELDFAMQSGADANVVQEGRSVFAGSGDGVSQIDVTTGQPSGSNSIPIASYEVAGGVGLVIESESGKLWVGRGDSVVAAPYPEEPDAIVSPGSRGVVTTEVGDRRDAQGNQRGKVFIVETGGWYELGLDETLEPVREPTDSPTSTTTTVEGGEDESAGEPLPIKQPDLKGLPVSFDQISGLTAVGDTLVFLLVDGTVVSPGGTAVAVPGESTVLQQVGPDADVALVASTEGLFELELGGTKLEQIAAGGGSPAAPIRVGPCVFGAWSGDAPTSFKSCSGTVLRDGTPIPNAQPNAELVYRVNQNNVALNSPGDGGVWADLAATLTFVGNWDDVDEPEENPTEDDESPGDGPVEATCVEEGSNPPTAAADQLGVRARPSIIDVLYNDDDVNCEPIAIAEITPAEGPWGQLTIIDNGQHVLYSPSQEMFSDTSTEPRPVTFAYVVEDADGNRSEEAVVDLTVKQRGVGANASPELRPNGTGSTRQMRSTVEEGRGVSYNVLADWWDADGDDLQLVGAIVTDGGEVSTTPDGTVRYTANGVNPGVIQVSVTVSDGVATSTELMEVTVQPAGSDLPPIPEDDFLTLVSGQTATVYPLENDSDPNEDLLEVVPGWPAENDGFQTRLDGAGGVEITALAAGVYDLDYAATDGVDSESATIRLNVVEASESNSAPVAVPDKVQLRADRVVNVDVLANDIDRDGDLMGVVDVAVSNANVEAGEVRASIVDRRLVQIEVVPGPSGEAPTGPFDLTYQVSDGRESERASENADNQVADSLRATGAVSVVVQPASEDQAPILANDTATVRLGEVVSVPVLRNDVDPDADAIVLESVDEAQARELEATGQGVAWIEGSEVFFQGGAPGRASILYTASAGGRPATGEVTFEVRPAADVTTNPNQAPDPPDLVLRAIRGGEVRLRVLRSGIDPDGDAVDLIEQFGELEGAAQGNRVSVDPENPDVVLFKAGLNAEASDRFTYTVRDPLGETGSATVSVLILDDRGWAPQAHDDVFRGRPGRTLSVPVVANDSSPQDRRIEIAELPFFNLEGEPTAVAESPDAVRVADQTDEDTRGRIEIVVPTDESTINEHYRITDGTNPGDAFIRVTPDPEAPNLPPVANLDEVEPAAVIAGAVVVDVVANDFDPDDASGALTLSVPANQQATVTGNSLSIPLTEHSRTVLYRVADTDGAEMIGQVRVPGLENHPPTLNEVGQNPENRVVDPAVDPALAISLAEILEDPDGDPDLRLTATEVTVPGGLGSVERQSDGLGITYQAPEELSETTTVPITFEATDRPELSDEERQADNCHCLATLTVEVIVQASSPPRVIAQGAVQVPQLDEVVSYDLAPLVIDDQGDALTFALLDSGELDVQLAGTVLTIVSRQGGDNKLPVGRTVPLRFSVRDEQHDPVEGTVAATIVSTNKGKPAAASFAVIEAERDKSLKLPNLVNAASNPFPDRPLTLVSSSVSGARLTCAENGDCEFFADTVGSYDVKYRLTDAVDQAATGSLTVVVKGKPRAPGVPSIESVGDHAVKLSWTSADMQGGKFVQYQVTAVETGTTKTFTTTGGEFNGLTNGQTYHFTVLAENELGQGEPSAQSSPAVPDRVPDPPVNPVISDYGNGFLTLEWDPPPTARDFTAIIKYEVSIGGQKLTTDGSTTSLRVGTGGVGTTLQNGSSYNFTVRAQNSATTNNGWGQPSARSASETPSRYPDAPTAVTAANSGDGGQPRLTVTWAAPAFNGGRPITSYRVCRVQAAGNCQDIASGLKATFALPRGEASSFTVVAINSDKNRNNSDPSAASATLTAVGRPDTPVLAAPTSGDGRLDVSATTTNGSGCPNVSIEYRRDGGVWQASRAFTGLQNGTTYNITARAVLAPSCGTPGQQYVSDVTAPRPGTPYGNLVAPSISANVSGQTISFTWRTNRANDGRPGWTATLSGNGCDNQTLPFTANASGTTASRYIGPSASRSCTITVTANGVSPISSSATATTPAPRISISRGNPGPAGSWYSMSLSGFAANSNVTVECHDSKDSSFWTQTFTVDGSGGASDPTLCYSADGPDHWVTGGGVESNHVTW